jgi:hypothetical protein
MKVGPVIILVLFTINVAHSQGQQRQPRSSPQSSLAVTATVEPSVWLVMEPDGKRDLVVANASDPKESFSHAPATKARRKSAAMIKEHTSSAMPRKSLRNQDDNSVQFSFSTVSNQFEVLQKTVMMDVSEGAKTEGRPVTLTTIVAQ